VFPTKDLRVLQFVLHNGVALVLRNPIMQPLLQHICNTKRDRDLSVIWSVCCRILGIRAREPGIKAI
jgi:hypothetical protein